MPERLKKGLRRGEDGKVRCFWPNDTPDYMDYHDNEWGLPVADDNRLFEKVCLEGFQSGLSWLTVLRKRENFRDAFSEFEYEKVANFDKRDVEKLLNNAGIVRHRGKIESTINNAKRAREMAEEFGCLGAFFWKYEPDDANRPKRVDYKTLRTQGKTPESTALSKDLKNRGWSFVGPTTAYAFMQAMGMVNDHIEGCFTRESTERARKKFKRPS